MDPSPLRSYDLNMLVMVWDAVIPFLLANEENCPRFILMLAQVFNRFSISSLRTGLYSRQPPSQLQQKMLHFPYPQHGVGFVPSAQLYGGYGELEQHTAAVSSARKHAMTKMVASVMEVKNFMVSENYVLFYFEFLGRYRWFDLWLFWLQGLIEIWSVCEESGQIR